MKKREKKEKKRLDQIDISGILEQRARFKKRIIELGGKIPKPWPGPDRSGALRNLQLLERVEALERKRGSANRTSNSSGDDGASRRDNGKPTSMRKTATNKRGPRSESGLLISSPDRSETEVGPFKATS
jgi:hypothetical protein